MTDKRRKHNMQARLSRAVGGLLRQHRACIVDASLPEIQGVIHYKNCRQIFSKQVNEALINVAHHWSVNVIVLCVGADGERYMKKTEFVTAGVYLAKHIGDEIESVYKELADTCNPKHIIGNAWIAIPDRVELDQQQVERVLDAVGAWRQVEAA